VKGRRCRPTIVFITPLNAVLIGYPIPVQPVIAPLTEMKLQQSLSLSSQLSAKLHCTALTVTLLFTMTLCLGKNSIQIFC